MRSFPLLHPSWIWILRAERSIRFAQLRTLAFSLESRAWDDPTGTRCGTTDPPMRLDPSCGSPNRGGCASRLAR
jgi:hypothetical protein